MKKINKDVLINIGGFGIAGACILTGQCQIGIPVMAGLSVYNGTGAIKEFRASKAKEKMPEKNKKI